ncbi:MAG: hypothetical protein U0930_10200 [Pirellulales bacterium]
METTSQVEFQTRVVTRIAGEDIQPGDFITISSEVIELPSYFWCCDSLATAKDELIRLRFIPRESGEPYKVITVCLPFVYAKRSTGKLVTFDIRKHQLVKLDQSSGKKVWKRMKRVV